MSGPSSPRRLGQVIELRDECVQEYTRVHADGFPGVRDLLAKYHLHNFSIFLSTVAGRRLLFLYAEYTGESYEADMAGLSAEPRDVEWHKLCDPMQASFNPAGGWLPMECVSSAGGMGTGAEQSRQASRQSLTSPLPSTQPQCRCSTMHEWLA